MLQKSNTPIEVSEKQEKRLEGWKRYLALTYIGINLFDFVLMPLIYELRRPTFHEIAPHLKSLDGAAQSIILGADSWTPLTMNSGGLFHFAMGTILTGVAVFNNGYSNTPKIK